jgi:nucleoside-diphosphate-sugar epimerase
LLLELHRTRGLPVIILRPGVVLGEGGPLQHSGVGLWAKDTRCIGWGLGRVALPWVLAGDVAEALVRALAVAGIEGRTYNLVAGVPLSAREYLSELRRRCRRDFSFHPRPLWNWQALEWAKWLVKKIARRPAEPPSWHDLRSRSMVRPFDTRATRQELGWAPVDDREQFLSRALGDGTHPP